MTTPVPRRALTPAEALDQFVHAIGRVLEPLGCYQHGPAGGHEWRWSTPDGMWAVHVGGIIDAGPLIVGPGDNRWHTTEYTLQHADLVILMLRLAGALPPAASAPQGLDTRQAVARVGGERWLSPPGGIGPGIPLDGPDRPAAPEITNGLEMLDASHQPVTVRVIETGEVTHDVPLDSPFTPAEAEGVTTYHLNGYLNGDWLRCALVMAPNVPVMVCSKTGVVQSGDGRPLPYWDTAIAGSDVPPRGVATGGVAAGA